MSSEQPEPQTPPSKEMAEQVIKLTKLLREEQDRRVAAENKVAQVFLLVDKICEDVDSWMDVSSPVRDPFARCCVLLGALAQKAKGSR